MRCRNRYLFFDGNIRNSSVKGKFPLQRQLLLYAGRLLGRIELTLALLRFVLSVMSQADRTLVIWFVRRLQAARAGKKVSQMAPLFTEPIERLDVAELAMIISISLASSGSSKGGADHASVERLLKACVTRAGAEQPKADTGTTISSRMSDLQRLFGLDDDELALLSVVLCYSLEYEFAAFCKTITVQEKRELICILTDVSIIRVAQLTGRKGRLVRAGIIDVPDNWSKDDFYKLAQDIRDHLIGLGEESLALTLASPASPARYATNQFGVSTEAVRIVSGLLSAPQPCHILLHGVPGCGKTEFAKALASACGKLAYFVEHAKAANLQSGRVAVEAVTSAYQAEKCIVIVDEADELLNLQGSSNSPSADKTTNSISGKSWLNDFLDRCTAQVIWISNDIDAIEESSLRRFAYNIPFRRQTMRRRQEIWQEHLRDTHLRPLVTADDIAEMASQYRVGAAGIANALANTVRIVPSSSTDRDTVLGTLRELLASHARLTGGIDAGKIAGLSAQYDPAAICTDVPADGLLANLKACVSQRCSIRSAVNLLFWGPPGTGKTAFAQYLAQSLDKELIVRRASDLLSMFVGGTEHNIREAFEQADQEDAILLLDEADSFFIDRTRAQRSWETSQTNELLTQMENHHGILICCTNQLASLDHAVLRRFAWKVRFQAPTAEGRLRIYRRYFDSAENPVPAACLEQVARMESLTPGDMKAVWVRFRFRPAAEWNHAEIVHALAEEVTYRGKRSASVGFHGSPPTLCAAEKA